MLYGKMAEKQNQVIPWMLNTPQALYKAELCSLTLENSGKVRDIFRIDDNHLLIVASDRLSAFDVILPDPIPGKGIVLTAISNFWFAKTAHIITNHLVPFSLEEILPDKAEREMVDKRAVVVKKLQPLPVEAVVRGYLIGSGWKDYRKSGKICEIKLPAGLKQADKLPEPVFTPSTKAELGNHDENISFDAVVKLIGPEMAGKVRDISIRIYQYAAEYAQSRGIIIADTKFEFGTDKEGKLFVIDEMLTPDSSRFWPVDSYRTGISPPSFDKQYVRDYLETLDWNKKPPGPGLPEEVIKNTAAKYREAQTRLTGE